MHVAVVQVPDQVCGPEERGAEDQGPVLVIRGLEHGERALGPLPPDELPVRHADHLVRAGRVEAKVDGAVAGGVDAINQENTTVESHGVGEVSEDTTGYLAWENRKRGAAVYERLVAGCDGGWVVLVDCRGGVVGRGHGY